MRIFTIFSLILCQIVRIKLENDLIILNGLLEGEFRQFKSLVRNFQMLQAIQEGSLQKGQINPFTDKKIYRHFYNLFEPHTPSQDFIPLYENIEKQDLYTLYDQLEKQTVSEKFLMVENRYISAISRVEKLKKLCDDVKKSKQSFSKCLRCSRNFHVFEENTHSLQFSEFLKAYIRKAIKDLNQLTEKLSLFTRHFYRWMKFSLETRPRKKQICTGKRRKPANMKISREWSK